MFYHQYTTAIRENYREHPELAQHAAKAHEWRAWLESLELPPHLREALVEQARTIEEAFAGLAGEGG